MDDPDPEMSKSAHIALIVLAIIIFSGVFAGLAKSRNVAPPSAPLAK